MFYVLDENNNRVEAYDKEGVLATLEQAIADGSLANLVADAAFVTKLKCCVSGQTNRIAFVTQAKYNELQAAGLVENGVYYYITDDTLAEDITALLNELNDYCTNIDSGKAVVAHATLADKLKLNKTESNNEYNMLFYAAGNAEHTEGYPCVDGGNGPTYNPSTNTIKANFSGKLNSLEIKQDENGVLKIGDIIIPQKKVIWEGTSENLGYTEKNGVTLTFPQSVMGKTIEVELGMQLANGRLFPKFKLVPEVSSMPIKCLVYGGNSSSGGGFYLYLACKITSDTTIRLYIDTDGVQPEIYIYKVTEIIE